MSNKSFFHNLNLFRKKIYESVSVIVLVPEINVYIFGSCPCTSIFSLYCYPKAYRLWLKTLKWTISARKSKSWIPDQLVKGDAKSCCSLWMWYKIYCNLRVGCPISVEWLPRVTCSHVNFLSCLKFLVMWYL